jgi:uncharacterized SAM-binding protein YcdF (DUF218 family)
VNKNEGYPIGLAAVFRVAVGGLAAVGLLVIVVTITPLVSWWGREMAGPWNDPTGDVLIVLGGSLQDDRLMLMGQSAYLRSLYAVLVYREGGFRDVVLSGGGPDGPSVAEAMRAYLVSNGVPAASIHVESRSTTTHENALYAKPILANLPGRKVLLTSDYHMARAYRTFRKAGIDVLPRPLPDAIKRGNSYQTRWGAFVDLSRESVALAYYFARGWI